MASLISKEFLLAHKKFLIASLLLGALSGGFAATSLSEAAIPVIDTANIAKQAETLAETIKVVNTTTQQVALMLKDMKILPEDVYEKYVTGFEQGQGQIQKILSQQGGVYVGTPGINGSAPTTKADVSQILMSQFPSIGAGEVDLNNRTAVILASTGALMRNHESTLKIYQQITDKLTDANQRLDELLKLNQNAQGTVQAQQINAQISAIKVEIDTYSSYLSALDKQSKIYKDYSEAQQRQNDIQLAKNKAQAEKEAIEKAHDDYVNTPGKTYAIGGGWREELSWLN